ncbi:MAG: hypothetical protein K9M82_02305 [Deltaproteobacteria bacterium]|nr:hypothetical protein [Deltaproteobacteria bacterium]
MKSRMPGLRRAVRYGCLLVLVAAAGCATRSAVPERLLGSPEHHVANGIKLLGKGRLDPAQREFRIALALDPRCALAHRGEALVLGIRRDFDAAFAACGRAVRFTTRTDLESSLQEEFARCGAVRRGRSSRLRPVAGEEMTHPARLFVVEFLNAYYRMGVAFKLGGAHEEHEEALGNALSITEAFTGEASHHLQAAIALDGFAPGTEFARGVAFLDSVSRAEAAALLIRELDLVGLLGKPAGGEQCPVAMPVRPPDLEGHPLEKDLQTVLDLGIDGFATFDDGTFHPDSPMHRAAYASAVTDLLERMNHGEGILSEGPQLSPFEDVPLSSPPLRAAPACVKLRILDGREGRFRPAEPLSGQEAAKSLHRLKALIQSE